MGYKSATQILPKIKAFIKLIRKKFNFMISRYTVKFSDKIIQLLVIPDYFQLITTSIAIIILFHSIEYFTAKPEIKHQIYPMNERFYVFYDLQKIDLFYKENAIPMPLIIKDDPIYGEIFSKDKNTDWGMNILKSTPFYIDNYLRKADLPKDFYEFHIDTLISGFHTYRYKESKVHLLKYPRSKIDDILDHFRKKMSDKDFFLFISALLRTRIILNYFHFKNYGNIDLNDIQIKIYPPFSSVNQDRSNNIEKINFASPYQDVLYEIEHSTKNWNVKVPFLDHNNDFLLEIFTKENKISDEEILITYNYKPVLDQDELWRNFCTIFISLWILNIVGNKYLVQYKATK